MTESPRTSADETSNEISRIRTRYDGQLRDVVEVRTRHGDDIKTVYDVAETDPQIPGYVVDSFVDGAFADGWEDGTQHFDTTADPSAADGYAAHRSQSGYLVASPDSFDRYPDVGDGYLTWTVYFDGTSGFHMSVTAAAENLLSSARVDYALYNGDLLIRTYEDGSYNTRERVAFSPPQQEYLTCVGHIDDEKIAHFWVYDGNNTELEYISASVDSED